MGFPVLPPMRSELKDPGFADCATYWWLHPACFCAGGSVHLTAFGGPDQGFAEQNVGHFLGHVYFLSFRVVQWFKIDDSLPFVFFNDLVFHIPGVGNYGLFGSPIRRINPNPARVSFRTAVGIHDGSILEITDVSYKNLTLELAHEFNFMNDEHTKTEPFTYAANKVIIRLANYLLPTNTMFKVDEAYTDCVGPPGNCI